MRARMLMLLAGLALVSCWGCSRTDDGSVTVADPLRVGRYLNQPPSPPTTPPVRSGSQVFPVSPSYRPAGSSRSVSVGKAGRRASQQAVQERPAAGLSCRDAAPSGGRVHVVCE